MEDKARVIISLSEGKIDVSGSEKFVREQLDRFKNLIDKKLSAVPVQAPQPTISTQTPPLANAKVAQTPMANGANAYSNVIAVHEDEIKILNIKGDNKAEKITNIALLYLLAKKQKKEDIATFEEIRKVCKEHACMDQANFSTIIKSNNKCFIIGGSKRKFNVKLTAPGLREAKALAKELDTQ
jgi:hypothetical protein